MTFDTSPLEKTCVILSCSRPAVDPNYNRVHCAVCEEKLGLKPAPRPPVEPEVQVPEPTPARMEPPDPTQLEPHWDGTQWVLRAKEKAPTVSCPHCGQDLHITLS